jgi:hypothetical protein
MHSMLRVLPFLFCVFACDSTDDPPDPCTDDFAPAIEIGYGVSGAFERFTPDQEVSLVIAPQGGFGVDVRVRTQGLVAGQEALVTLLLETLIDDVVVGSFENLDQALTCTDTGGLVFGVVVGFDPDDYATNDDLLALDGQQVDLRVTVTDRDGAVVASVQPVIIRAGG